MSATDQAKKDEQFMRRCFELAKTAFEQGNTPVGSIVVRGDTIIAEGIEALPTGNDITGHAELVAVQKATSQLGTKLLHNTALYTTAEPCFMCSYAIRGAEVTRVVYCLDTPVIGGVTSKHPILVDESLNEWKLAPEVVSGVLKPMFLELKSNWKNESARPY